MSAMTDTQRAINRRGIAKARAALHRTDRDLRSVDEHGRQMAALDRVVRR